MLQCSKQTQLTPRNGRSKLTHLYLKLVHVQFEKSPNLITFPVQYKK